MTTITFVVDRVVVECTDPHDTVRILTAIATATHSGEDERRPDAAAGRQPVELVVRTGASAAERLHLDVVSIGTARHADDPWRPTTTSIIDATVPTYAGQGIAPDRSTWTHQPVSIDRASAVEGLDVTMGARPSRRSLRVAGALLALVLVSALALVSRPRPTPVAPPVGTTAPVAETRRSTGQAGRSLHAAGVDTVDIVFTPDTTGGIDEGCGERDGSRC
jgi:hypothetical protein